MSETIMEVYANEDDNVSAVLYFEDNIVLSACLSNEWIDESIDDIHHHLSGCEIRTFTVENPAKPVEQVLASIAEDSGGTLISINPAFISTMDKMVNIKRIVRVND